MIWQRWCIEKSCPHNKNVALSTSMEFIKEYSVAQVSSKMHSGGRIIVPFSLREALHLGVGDELLLRVEDGELRVIPQAEAIRRAQRLVAQYIPASVSLVDELIEERRAESVQEGEMSLTSERGIPLE
jgi:AbrB family looped-hinge helix DNA binding protein